MTRPDPTDDQRAEARRIWREARYADDAAPEDVLARAIAAAEVAATARAIACLRRKADERRELRDRPDQADYRAIHGGAFQALALAAHSLAESAGLAGDCPRCFQPLEHHDIATGGPVCPPAG